MININPFYLEIELIKPVTDYLKNQGYIVRREIKIGFFHADIVGFKNDIVTSIELKLNDWRKAIIQAKNYQLGSNYVYIAFPLMKSYNVMRKAEFIFKKEGIGLLTVNEKTCEVCEIIKPKASTRMFGGITLKEINRLRKNSKKMNIFY